MKTDTPNIPKGSGVQPPDGSTERLHWVPAPGEMDTWWLHDETGRIVGKVASVNLWGGRPYFGEARGQRLGEFVGWLAAQAAVAREAVCAEPTPPTAGASENSGTDEPSNYDGATTHPEFGDHLSEQPSVDRCVLTDEQIEPAAIELWTRLGADYRLEWGDEPHKAEFRLAVRAVLAAVHQQSSEPDVPKYILGGPAYLLKDARGVREALARLVAKLDEIIAHPAYRGLFVELQIRGRPYNGPDFGEELEAARSALALRPVRSVDESGAVAGAVRRPDGETEL